MRGILSRCFLVVGRTFRSLLPIVISPDPLVANGNCVAKHNARFTVIRSVMSAPEARDQEKNRG
jgi:hypothetical protein